MAQQALKTQLLALAEPAYRDFAAGLLPGVTNVLGVRMPALAKLAKQLAKKDWRGYLDQARDDSYEETMLQGMVIGLLTADARECLRYAAWFIPKLDNWGVCDSFCSALKIARREPELVWSFIQPYFLSTRPFEIRFALVMALNYYMDDAHMAAVLDHADRIRHENYYVKMAVAWLVSICFVHRPAHTMAYLQNCSLDTFTYRKALSKILESRRVSQQDRQAIRALRSGIAQRRSK